MKRLTKDLMKKLINWVFGFDLSKLSIDEVYIHQDNFLIPKYATDGSAGADIVLDLKRGDSITIQPGETVKLPTGLHLEIPEGIVGLLFSRSGLSTKGLSLVNGVGVIDSDYRGEVGVPVKNTTNEPIVLTDCDRIAQLLLLNFHRGKFINCWDLNDLTKTERGNGGFGSTGTNIGGKNNEFK